MRLAPLAWFCALAACGAVPPEPGPARARMVEDQIAARGVRDPAVLAAMREVPRHLFVPPPDRAEAYEDHPLPIGHGQTISQPYIVALMTELARPKPGHVALEVGTGSGYQAAILSRIVRRVHTIELLEPLARTAERRLSDLGYLNVKVRAGDGYNGWPEAAPFDIILVTASASDIPPPLVKQLKAGGRMVIPVGRSDDVQELKVVEKAADGSLDVRSVIPVRFVPLLRRPREPGRHRRLALPGRRDQMDGGALRAACARQGESTNRGTRDPSSTGYPGSRARTTGSWTTSPAAVVSLACRTRD